MNPIKTSIFILIVCLSLFSQDIQRGSIAFGLGSTGIAAGDYGESAMNNPAGLTSINKLEVDGQAPNSVHLGVFFNPGNSMALGASFRSFDSNYSNVSAFAASMGKKISGSLSAGVSVRSLVTSDQPFQKFGVDLGFIYQISDSLKIGGVWNSQSTVKALDSVYYRYPHQFGAGLVWIFSGHWELRNDYVLLYNPFVNNGDRQWEVHAGIVRELLFARYYEGNYASKLFVFSMKALEKLVPQRYGIYLQNIGGVNFSEELHYTFGWSNIDVFPPTTGENVFELQIGLDKSKKNTRWLCGVTIGNRPNVFLNK